MIKRIAAAAVLTGAALTMTATVASAAPMPHTPTSNAGETVAPPNGEMVPDKPPTSISPDGTRELGKLNQLGQVTQVTKALDPALGLLAPITGLVPA
ncbi:hypothetical protein QZH56_11920 [Streptomyces olivoreticuli]|uniref:hypothetical protein n=1 Tax=Streptomyces olivoreticuli TaxID=68246 RepID=UPI00265985D3|nr:hypothetical protein [Streptomyces olivoreticuli]WKK26229.1 hypothetical protein QZH56_11920 [Streptomyces olivoreticuli]